MIRGVNLGGGVMQIPTGMNTANGFLQSIPVQNIPGIGNIQVISASQLQPQVQAMPAPTPTPIVATVAPNAHIEQNDQKWQIVQAISQSNPPPQPPSPPVHTTINNVASNTNDEVAKPHRRRVACTCPNCGDSER